MLQRTVEDGLRNPFGVMYMACSTVYGYRTCDREMHAASRKEIGGNPHSERPCHNHNLLIPFSLTYQ